MMLSVGLRSENPLEFLRNSSEEGVKSGLTESDLSRRGGRRTSERSCGWRRATWGCCRESSNRYCANSGQYGRSDA